LVTGGAGFIGCALSSHLASRYSHVVALDNLHPQIHATPTRPAFLSGDVELVVGDVTTSETWDNLLPSFRPQVIIHLAAETGTGQSLTESTRHAQTNVMGTTVMLDALQRHNALPETIVLSSSRAVYGEGAWQNLADGTLVHPGQRTREQLARAEWDFAGHRALPSSATRTRPSPVSVYGATKLAQEHLLSSWAQALGTRLVMLRLQNVYGPGQSLTNSYTGIVSLFCQLARQGKSIPLYEDGQMLRDFVLIDDVAAAFVHALADETIGPAPLDIGTGLATTLAEMAHTIAALYDAPAPHVCGKYRLGDVRHTFCVQDETLKRFDWKPRHSIKEGLVALTSWIDRQSSLL
jgi:dTDP-L-rhamnose 4-epimerase